VVLLRKDCFGWVGLVDAADKLLQVKVLEKSHQVEERIEESTVVFN
jgi:hypothetical protein